MLVMSFFDDVNQLPQQIAGEYLCFHREFINTLIKVAHDDLLLIVIGIQQKLIHCGVQHVCH